MKKLILYLIPFLMIACKSSTYYEAMNTNKQRFDGWQGDNAKFMVDSHDQIQLIEDLSEAAQSRSKLRETYLLSLDIQEELRNLHTSYQIEATVHRIKLASSLSEPSDRILQKLESISDENFDQVYLRYLKSELTDLDQTVSIYLKDGHNERLKTLAQKVELLIDKIEQSTTQIS